MRSRYAAYAVGAVDYIVDTTDPEGDAYESDRDSWRRRLRQYVEGTEFQNLEVLEHREDGERAEVSFRAKLRQDGGDASFSERSEFRMIDGDWYYSHGETIETEDSES